MSLVSNKTIKITFTKVKVAGYNKFLCVWVIDTAYKLLNINMFKLKLLLIGSEDMLITRTARNLTTLTDRQTDEYSFIIIYLKLVCIYMYFTDHANKISHLPD